MCPRLTIHPGHSLLRCIKTKRWGRISGVVSELEVGCPGALVRGEAIVHGANSGANLLLSFGAETNDQNEEERDMEDRKRTGK